MEYKVGDKVLIKTWDEMVDKFGINSDGEIKTKERYWNEEKYNRWIPINKIITITFIYSRGELGFIDKEHEENFIERKMIKEKVMDNKEEIMEKIKELESKTEELKSMVGNLDKKEWVDTFEESKKLFPYWGFQDNYKYMVTPYGTIINADGSYIKSSEAKKYWKNNGNIYATGIGIKYKFKGFNTEKELYVWMAE